MMIDGHSHLTLPVEEHLAAMEREGIDKTVLFSTTFHPELAQNTQQVVASMRFLSRMLAGEAGSLAEERRKSVAELAETVRRHPSRYVGFGAVPMGLDAEETKRYVEENICKNRLAGMGEFTPGAGQAFRLGNVFEASTELGHLPLWIHAFFPVTVADIREIAGLAKKHPKTPVILGHLGGCNWMDAMELAAEIPNLYLDTSAYYSTFVLGAVINELPQKCLFGVDRPFGDIGLCRQAVQAAAKTPAVARAVLGENAARVLNL